MTVIFLLNKPTQETDSRLQKMPLKKIRTGTVKKSLLSDGSNAKKVIKWNNERNI